MWVDTHCHLDLLEGEPGPFLARAHQAGVDRLVTIGTDLASSRRAVELACEHLGVWAVVGIHPTEATGFTGEAAAAIEELGRHSRVVAIGEVGLDYYWDRSTPQEQDLALRTQIDIAKRLDKPVVLHIREAMEQVLTLLAEVGPPSGLVFHCFSGTAEEAERAVTLGGFISFAGNLTYKSAAPLREAALRVPLDRLLVETDSPYLAPVPMRGKKNEPAYVAYTGHLLAAAVGCSVETLATVTTANAVRVFGLPG
ncbi:MAG: TatD family hydrolase [Actinomycetota bacterium]